MNCHCFDYSELVWDSISANFFCHKCNLRHQACAVVDEGFICGEIEDHNGDHISLKDQISFG